MLCSYGCGNIATYQFKNGKWCCLKNHRQCPAVKHKVSQSIKDLHESGLYEENKSYEKIKCDYCDKLITRYLINKHKKSCYMNPKNIKYCKVCGKIVKDSITCSLKCRYE